MHILIEGKGSKLSQRAGGLRRGNRYNGGERESLRPRRKVQVPNNDLRGEAESTGGAKTDTLGGGGSKGEASRNYRKEEDRGLVHAD